MYAMEHKVNSNADAIVRKISNKTSMSVCSQSSAMVY